MVNSAVENAIDELTLFDDELMTLVFDQNVPAAECLLRIVLMDNTIKVKSVISQRELRAAEVGKRSVRLDILAEDAYGRLMNIEVQRRRDGAVPQRARLHSALVDTGILPEGAEFEEMPDSYVIFITEHDYYKAGLPRYTINRYLDEINSEFNDGSHIIYVNGDYQENDSFGVLMQDFHCAKPEMIKNPELANAVRHFKKEEGRNNMSRIMDELLAESKAEGREEGREEGRVEGATLTNRLVLLLAQDNRTEDFVKSASDPEFQKKLLKEYNLI